MKLFKIWNRQEGKKCIMAGSLADVFKKGGEKFGMKIRYVYLSDGTEIEDDEVLMNLESGTVLHLETFPTSPTTAVEPFAAAPDDDVLCNPPSFDNEIIPVCSESSSGSSDELQFTTKEDKASSSDHWPKRKLPKTDVDECSPKRGLSSGISPGGKMKSPRSTLPSPLQLPDNIPDDIIDILKNKPFHPTFYQARVTLVKKAREFFAGFCPYPTTQEYETMVLCIGRNFPNLSDPGVKESDSTRIKYSSLLNQLQQGFRNARRKSTQPPTSNKPRSLASIPEVNVEQDKQDQVDETGYKRMCDELKKQLNASKVNNNAVKRLLQETYPIRRNWICNEEFMSISKICDEFPFLLNPTWILHECSSITALEDVKEDATVNLQSCFQRIVVALGIAEEFEDEDVTSISNEKLWKVLKMIHDRLICNQKDFIIFQCEVGCNLKELFSKKGNEPFLVAIMGDTKEIHQIFIGAEKRELLEVEDNSVITAVTLLVSCYFVYNIAYKRGKNFMIFLQEFVLKVPDQSKKNSKYATFYKQIKG